MRIAVLADVHGDLGALDAVLEDAARRGVDDVFHLGDLAGRAGGAAVIGRIRERKIAGVKGHADLDALESGGVTGADRTFLEALPAQFRVEEGALVLWFVHGSPDDPREGLDENTPADRLDVLFRGTGAHVLVTGHTHRPCVREVGDRLLLNPGAVLPSPDGLASYLVLDTGSGIEAVHVRVPVCR